MCMEFFQSKVSLFRCVFHKPSEGFQPNAFTLDYCELKLEVFYNHLQKYGTTQATGPNCSISRYSLIVLLWMAFLHIIASHWPVLLYKLGHLFCTLKMIWYLFTNYWVVHLEIFRNVELLSEMWKKICTFIYLSWRPTAVENGYFLNLRCEWTKKHHETKQTEQPDSKEYRE